MSSSGPTRTVPRGFPKLIFSALLLVCSVPVSSEATSWSSDAEVAVEYNSNVFNLDRSARDRVDDSAPVDVATGRICDMESVGDVVLSARFRLEGKARSPLGGRFWIRPEVGYHRYRENTEKSYPELGLGLRQSLGEHAYLELDSSLEIDAFKKNYLYDTIGAGTIDPDERIYRRGAHDDLDVTLSYRNRRLWRRGPSGEVMVGYQRRRFDDFSNRDLDTWRGGFALESELGQDMDAELEYVFSRVRAPGDPEVLILDEPAAGVDLNGDLDTSDLTIRTVQAVDRSRREHRMGLELGWRVSRGLRAWARYRLRLIDYQSDEALDLAHRGREDTEHVVRVGATWKLRKGWKAEIEAGLERRRSSKGAGLVGDEDGDKRQALLGVSIGHSF